MLLTNVCNFVNVSQMSREQRYTPLASIPSAYDGQNGQMTWNFSLPPTVDTERLVMDSRQLRRIMTVVPFVQYILLSIRASKRYLPQKSAA